MRARFDELLLCFARWVLARYFHTMCVVKDEHTGQLLALVFAVDRPVFEETFTIAPRTPHVEHSEAVH